MSGICGLFNANDAPVTEMEIGAMTSMLERRGPERTGRWREQHVGLGHTLLATTPELQYERQPFHHRETGCAITADVRLDNRSELLHALDLVERCESLGDAELILIAYVTWGESCVDHLLGDFAFAISDPRQKMLFCARDHSGLRPFYYFSEPGKRFLFASDARAILVLPQVPYELDQGRIADYLVPQLEWIDYTSTFYVGVCRLPPGHRATVTESGVRVTEYWHALPPPVTASLSDDDYAEGFLDVFTQAVEVRLRAPANATGSMLSGGMDSGSVVAVAREILGERGDKPLRTYSCVRRQDSDCSETRAINAAICVPSIDPILIDPDDLPDIHESLLRGNEEPFDGELMILKSIYLAANDQGQRVVLDGGGGDIVLSEGSHIVRLIRQGQIQQAFAEIAAEKNFRNGTSLLRDLFRYTLAAAAPESVKNKLRPWRQRTFMRESLRESLISSDFADSVDIEWRFERMRQIFHGRWVPNYAEERCDAIRPNSTAGVERYVRLAASAAVEASDPFLDKRVIEFCSMLPGPMRIRNGWPKILLRDLMLGKIPEKVRWSRAIPHLGWLFNESVARQALNSGQLSLSGLRRSLGDYVDPTSLTEAWHGFVNGGDAEAIHSANTLSIWLSETSERPVVPD